jgi:hypothetical protein
MLGTYRLWVEPRKTLCALRELRYNIDMARMLSSSGVMQDPAAMFPKLAELIGYLDSIDHRADLATLQQLLTKLDVTRCDIASTCIFGATASVGVSGMNCSRVVGIAAIGRPFMTTAA